MPLNVPNILTWIRILMIPLVIGVFYVPEVWLSSWHRNLIATALFGAAAVIVLVELERVDAIIAVVIIGREIAVSALREWMAKIGQAKSVAVNFLGKIKTISQMIAVPLLLFHERT